MAKTKPYRVLVCGSRFHHDEQVIWDALDAYRSRIGPRMLLITGGASGADDIARAWAVQRKVDHVTLYAKWDTEGKAAGPIRNMRMLKLKPKLVLAFFWHTEGAKNRGTRHMCKIAEDAGVKVKRFH